MENDQSSRRSRRKADAERRWQAILRAAIIGAYCVVLVVAGLYLGVRGRHAPNMTPAAAVSGGESDASSRAKPDKPAAADRAVSGHNTLETSRGPKAAAGTQSQDQPEAEPETQPAVWPAASPKVEPAAQSEIMARPVFGQIAAGPRWVFSDFMKEWRYIPGVDISAQPGACVTAALSGTVLSVRKDPILGIVVTLQHRENLVTEYGRLSACMLGVGDTVKQGQEIARALGPTVYFGAAKHGEPVSIDFAR